VAKITRDRADQRLDMPINARLVDLHVAGRSGLEPVANGEALCTQVGGIAASL
jgi:hypothetical protein